MNASYIISIITAIIETVAVAVMFASAFYANKKVKELSHYVEQLEKEKAEKDLAEGKSTFTLVENLNKVSKYIIDYIPKVYTSSRVSITMKKHLIAYLTYFAEYDRDEFDWCATTVKDFNECGTVSEEAKLVRKHITEAGIPKERVMKAILFLIIKAKS